MAHKLALTRLELKQQREGLARFHRFLPALQRRQQQLQIEVQRTRALQQREAAELQAVRQRFAAAASVLGDVAGVDVRGAAEPVNVNVRMINIAGVRVPDFVDVTFETPAYSLFSTAPWVELVLVSLREQNRRAARLNVLEQRLSILSRELARVVQRVNLFEKIKIPEAEAAIHKIRVHLGDEMAAAVGLAKMAKGRT